MNAAEAAPGAAEPEPNPGVAVAAWFEKWAAFHRDVCPREDWGDLGKERYYWDNVKLQFVRRGIHDLAVAVEASRRVSVLELKKKGDHLAKLTESAVEIYRERREAHDPASGVPRTRADAELEAAGCLDCGGRSGIASRYVHAGLVGRFRTAGGHPIPFGHPVAMYCCCALGRWMRVAEAEADEGPSRGRKPWEEGKARVDKSLRVVRLPDLAAYPDLVRGEVPWSDQPDNWACHHPDAWDGLHHRPMDAMPLDAKEALAALRGMIRRDLDDQRRDQRRENAEPRAAKWTDPSFGKPQPLYGVGVDSPASTGVPY